MDEDSNRTPGIDKLLCDTIVAMSDEEPEPSSEDDREDSLLGPVKFWGESARNSGGLQPGIKLSFSSNVSEDEDHDGPLMKRSKVAKKAETGKLKVRFNFLSLIPSI